MDSKQIHNHNNINESLQSAYESDHSTETADIGQPVIFVLLDLYVAFDTVDHNIPFSRLKTCLVSQVKYLNGFDPIWNNVRGVSVCGILSDIQHLICGVPQGSVLVPLVSQFIPVLLRLLRSDMGLNISCIVMTHSFLYHWILTMNYISPFP